MSGYILAPEAEDDLFQIWCYLVVEAGLQTADRLETRLFGSFETLVKNPHLGHKRSDLTNFPVLFLRVRPYSYLIVYQPEPQIQIVGVLHGNRDIENVLRQRLS